MKKKILYAAAAVCVAFAFAACGNEKGTSGAGVSVTAEDSESRPGLSDAAGNNGTDAGVSDGKTEAAENKTEAAEKETEAVASYGCIVDVCGTKFTEMPVDIAFLESCGWTVTMGQEAFNYAEKDGGKIKFYCSGESNTVSYISISYSPYSSDSSDTSDDIIMSDVTVFDGISIAGCADMDEAVGKIEERGIKVSRYTDFMGSGFNITVRDESRNFEMEISKENGEQYFIGITAISEKPENGTSVSQPQKTESRVYMYDAGNSQYYINVDIYDNGSVTVSFDYYPNTYVYYDSVDTMNVPSKVMSYSSDGAGGTGMTDLGYATFTMTDDTLTTDFVTGAIPEDAVFGRVNR